MCGLPGAPIPPPPWATRHPRGMISGTAGGFPANTEVATNYARLTTTVANDHTYVLDHVRSLYREERPRRSDSTFDSAARMEGRPACRGHISLRWSRRPDLNCHRPSPQSPRGTPTGRGD